MAKRIVDEEMRFSVVINGDKAQKELFDLEKRNRSLTASNKDLRAEQAKLVAQGKKNSAEYKNLTAEIKRNNTEISENKNRMKVLQLQIGVTGLTMRQLQQRASQLRLQLLNMVPGSKQYRALENDLKRVNNQLFKLRNGAKASEGSLSRLANGFNKYAALGASAIAVLTGWVLSAQQMIDYNGKLADAQSDVQKTTQMTKEEVDDLTKSFGLLKTRTQRIDLLKIAEEGGRVGIVKNEILDFVNVMNKATVALGDSFPGGVEEVASKLGILKGLFKETKDLRVDLAFNAIGSSINNLGADGNATESNIADFAARVGALPESLKPAIGDALALGAAFEESGIQSEIAARGYGIVLGNATTNTEKFAKVMGMGQKQVEDLINTNPTEFFLQFANSLKGLNATETGDTLKYLGISADGVKKILGSAADNQERFRKTLELSNNSLVDATSLTEEYNIKNNNLAATLDKIKKKVLGAFTSEEVVDGLNSFVEWFAKFIGASDDADGSVTRLRNRLVALLKSILIITAAVISYRIAVQLAAIWTGTLDKTTRLYILTQRVATVASTALRAVTLLWSAAMALATGNITRARAALLLFNRTMLLSPIGLVIGAITAAVAAYYLFSEASEEAATSQSILNDVMQEAGKQTAETISRKKLLLDVARDETISLKQRQEAVDELNRTVPEYNNQLTVQTANTLEAKAALDKHIESLKQSAIAYVLQERIKKKAVELYDQENASLDDMTTWTERLWNAVKNGGNVQATLNAHTQTAIQNKNEAIAATKEEIAILEELYKTQLKNNPDQSVGGSDTGPKEGDEKTINGKVFIFKNGQWVRKNPFVAPKGDAGSASTKVDQAKKEAAALLQLQRETEDQRIAMIDNAFAREMAKNDVNQKRRIQDLQIKSDEVLMAADKALDSGDTDLYAILMKQYNELYDQIEQADEEFQNNRNEILEKGIENHIKKLEEQYKREETQREIAHNEALAALGTNEEAKKELQESFDKERSEREKANLQTLKTELEKILDTENFKGFDLEFLSEEQLQELKDRLQSLGLSISEIDEILSGIGKDDLGFIGGGDTDILGFSPDQWFKIFENFDSLKGSIQGVVAGLTVASNAFSLLNEFQQRSDEARLKKYEQNNQKEKNELDSLLQNKLISQRQYDKSVEAADKKLEKKKAEIAYKQAKRERTMALTNIALQTSQAIMGIWAQVPKFDFGISAGLLTAFVAGLGLAQAAAVLTTDLPVKGFQDGFYGNMPVRREQDGKVFNAGFGGESRSGLVDKPTVFLAGEQGKNFPELIINGGDLKQINPDVTQSLYRELGRIRGFEGGYYPKETTQSTDSSSNENFMLAAALNRNSQILERLEERGVIAYMSRDYNELRKYRDEIKKLETIERKSVITQ